MLLVDDLLVRPFLSLLQTLRVTALQELYDTSEIRDELKENQLLYELGERDEQEYERRRRELQRELDVAEQIHEQLGDRVTVKR
jgi:hypothetical protein